MLVVVAVLPRGSVASLGRGGCGFVVHEAVRRHMHRLVERREQRFPLRMATSAQESGPTPPPHKPRMVVTAGAAAAAAAAVVF